MHWIKPAAVTLALWLGGCANQHTILPAHDRSMLEIYRGALGGPAGTRAELPNWAALCQTLDLKEPLAACEDKVATHLTALYAQLDARAPPPPLDYVPYTRELATELEALFPRLPNPDLVIYVYPHLATRSRVPVPGYSTVMPLYEQVQYRLPGEHPGTVPVLSPASHDPAEDTAPPRYQKSSHLDAGPPETAAEDHP